ncbi:hypothetical protein [Spiroplasma diminutum]|uniref:Uncharacterized protein n=1 Tax=Spiroplasma diminutum CUAS-1 TaxID=1276221 RepID=S5M244_9MOLU|nr:hypothetical protein [Spiroplasma diminutum]AGR42142.1 hypothetical protein SDIMI_v3c04380 [Spiroplasma diminutum CUAS-1]
MQTIVDKNYFLDKLSKDREINDLISKQSNKDNLNFFENLKELRRILHLKSQTDKKILHEYNKLIVIPTGSEETLIRELHEFNNEMYDDLPEHYTLNFKTEVNKENKIIKEKPSNLKTIYKKNILNLSKPYIQDSSIILDETIEPNYLEKTFQDFETLLLNEPIINNDNSENYLDKILNDKEYESEILKSSSDIFVESMIEKEEMISNIRNNLSTGNYGKLNLTKTFSLSTTKYMKKLETLKKGFVKTYGSEMFQKISEWISQEESLYENIDRTKKINNLKMQKLDFKKKRKFKVKPKRKF